MGYAFFMRNLHFVFPYFLPHSTQDSKFKIYSITVDSYPSIPLISTLKAPLQEVQLRKSSINTNNQVSWGVSLQMKHFIVT